MPLGSAHYQAAFVWARLLRQVLVFDDAAQFVVGQGEFYLAIGKGGDDIGRIGEDDAVCAELEVVRFVQIFDVFALVFFEVFSSGIKGGFFLVFRVQ